MRRTERRGRRRVGQAGAAALVAAAVIAGCDSESATNTGSATDDSNTAAPLTGRDDTGHPLDNSRWRPDRVVIDGTQHVRPARASAQVVLLPDPSPGGTGTGGSFVCNSFDLETSRHGEILRVKRGSTTEKSCEPQLMAFEQAFLTAFEGDLDYDIHDADIPGREPGGLTLTNAAGDTIHLINIDDVIDLSKPREDHVVEGPQAAAYLADSRWIIDWLFIDSAHHPRPEEVTDADAFLELRPGHGKEGFQPSDAKAGCNHIQLESTLHGDTLRVRATTVTDMACPGPAGLFELDFLDVLDGDLSFEIRDEDGPGDNRPARLLLTNAEHDSVSLTEDQTGQ